MAFSLIPGHFHITNYSPDGDSIRFEPEDQAAVRALRGGGRARFNQRGHVQLRIEAIDTLETHFQAHSGGAGALHQPMEQAWESTDYLLTYLGFDLATIVWDARHRNVIATEPVSVPGFIMARSVERNGRPVSFVFNSQVTHPEANAEGESFLNVELLKESYNYKAVAVGAAYATFYQGLFFDLRTALALAAVAARQDSLGVYANDRTTQGFEATDLSVITDQVAIMPKLFRRLSDYMVNTGSALGFQAAMLKVREKVLDLRTSNFTHFDTFIEQKDATIRLTRHPEELVFDETQPQPGPVLANLLSDFDKSDGASSGVMRRKVLSSLLAENGLDDLV